MVVVVVVEPKRCPVWEINKKMILHRSRNSLETSACDLWETCRTRPSSVSHLGPSRAWVLATGTLKTARLVGLKPQQARWLDVTSRWST